MSNDEWMDKENVMCVHAHTHTQWNNIQLQKRKPSFFVTMDSFYGHFTKWNKSDRERQILIGINYSGL